MSNTIARFDSSTPYQRNYGIDLFRVVSMLMVLLLHILGSGIVAATAAAKLFSVQYMTAEGLRMAVYSAVNCYALISGYVGLNSRHRLSGYIALYLQVLFYSTGITALFFVLRMDALLTGSKLAALTPLSSNTYWYFTAYTYLFFCMPLLDHAVKTLDRSKLIGILAAIFVLFSLFPTFLGIDGAPVSGGYSFLWLAALYLIGAYIRQYDLPSAWKKSRFLTLYIACTVITWTFRLVLPWACKRYLGREMDDRILMAYTSPTMLLSAIGLLCFFATLRLGDRLRRVAAFFSPLTFGVYLIHIQPIISRHFIKGRFTSFAELPAPLLAIASIGTALGLFIACTMIDWLRLKLFKLIRIPTLCVALENLAEKLLTFLKRRVMK